MKQWASAAVLLIISAVVGCDRGQSGSSGSGGDVSLTGAGATFPKPLYEKWASDYANAKPAVRINYQGIGSGGGIKQITEQTVDFGATDGPMTDEQLKKASGKILHIPTVLGAVVPIYNVAGVDKELVFSGEVLAELFLGKITKWNDPKLTALNPDAKLPDKNVTIVHRSDGSGTTFIFLDYLAKVSKEWEAGPGRATTVNWPVGRGAKGNDGVAADVKQNDGSLGYVELIYAANNNIPYGNVLNPAGKAIRASEETVSAAAASIDAATAGDLRISITNAAGEKAYPISSLTWILVYEDQKDAGKAKALVDFLWWATHDGQAAASPLHYAPLPATLVPLVEAKLKSITASGTTVLSGN